MEQTPREWRRQLIKKEHELSLRRQCVLLGLNRSTVYYSAKPADVGDVDALNAIRDIWERYPFYGYRKITKELKAGGININRKRVQRLMALGELKAIYPGPNTSKRNMQHKVHPYLLRDLSIVRVNQAWMVDITYLRMQHGFMYLVAIIDVYSRYVISWSLSNTLDTAFCIEALNAGLKIATPEIMNSDQGCQFTSDDWIKCLQEQGIKISMTGKGRCLDNIYIERFWRSFKYEDFYLNEYVSVRVLRSAINAYIEFYNHKRWHQSLDYKRPAEVYFSMVYDGNHVDMWTYMDPPQFVKNNFPSAIYSECIRISGFMVSVYSLSPDGIRALFPNRVLGLNIGHRPQQVLKEPVSTILPSKKLSFATRLKYNHITQILNLRSEGGTCAVRRIISTA